MLYIILSLLSVYYLYHNPGVVTPLKTQLDKKFKDNSKYKMISEYVNTITEYVQLASNILYEKCYDYMTQDDVTEKDDSIHINYKYKGNSYTVIVPKRHMVSNTVVVVDENDNDISTTIQKYIGPSGWFHSINGLTPRMMSQTKITIKSILDDIDMTFNEDDIIAIL